MPQPNDDDALFGSYFNAPDPIAPIHNAFIMQESGGNPNVPTSVTGAMGPGQIQPDTFKQYAQPGERINNPADNVAVSKRILQDYYKRYNGDTGRMAVAYFSGPGNVAPPDSPTPWVKDKADPTGKSTSSYVSDIGRRLGKSSPDDALLHNYFSQPDIVPSPGPGIPTRITVRPPTINQPPAANLPTTVPGWVPPELASLYTGVQNAPANALAFPGNVYATGAEAFKAGGQRMQQGATELGQGNYLPSFPSTDPQTWGAGGVLNTALGAQGMIFSPASGLLHEGIGVPITQLTGNPQAGETAETLAGLIGGARFGAKPIIEATVPHVRATNALVQAVGPENIPAVVSRLERDPNLSLMDVAPGVQTRAMGIAQNEGAGQDILFNRFEQRTKGAAGGDYTPYEQLGPQSNVVQDREAIVQHAKNVGEQLIQPAVENAAPVPIKPILRSLDKAIGSPEAIAGETPRIPLDPTQQRLLKLRKEITSGEAAPINERVGLAIGPINEAIKSGKLGPQRVADFTEARRLLNSARRGITSEEDLVRGLTALSKNQKIVGPIDDALNMIKKGPTEYRGADFLHGIQSRLREEAEALRSSATGSERFMSKDLFDARDKLIDNIDKASGGQYRPALSKYRDAFDIRKSFDQGINVERMRSGEQGIEDSPEAWREWASQASPEEKLAAQKGALWSLKRKVGMLRNAGVTGGDMPPPLSPFTRQKLETLFGKSNTDGLVEMLQNARARSETNSLLFRQSKTARTQEGIAAMKPRDVQPISHGSGFGLPIGVEMAGSVLGHPEAGTAGALALLGASALRKGGQALMQKSDLARNALFAHMASATGAEREPILNLLRSRQPTNFGPRYLNALTATGRALLPP